MKRILACVAIVAAAAGSSPGEEGAERLQAPMRTHVRWSPELVDLFARLPVQDGGRVKPLSTFANFTLLALNGRRGCATPGGEQLTPTEWLMDCFFYTEEAVHYPCFLIQDAGVLDGLGLGHEGKQRRDRYSYADLEPAREKLFGLGAQYEGIDARRRNPVQAQVVNLARNVSQFEKLAGFLSVLGSMPDAAESRAIAAVFGAEARPGLAEILGKAGELKPWLEGTPDDPHGPGGTPGSDPLAAWARSFSMGARGIALFPPLASAPPHAAWLRVGDLVDDTLFRGAALPDQLAALADLEAMLRLRDDRAGFAARAESFRGRVVAAAGQRGEYAKIPLEAAFYRANLFTWAQAAYAIGFVLAAFAWFRTGKALPRLSLGSVIVATLLLAIGITLRCVIRGRPPVTTLYESVLFATGISVVVSLAAEFLHRQGIALALATVLGAAGLLLADRYELQEGVDTMPSLVAVLDTNFWLASHVTTVTIGYGAGLLAGAIGHVTILGRLFGLKRHDEGFYKSLASMTYGVLCFGLLFSVVGTVLGGIWANESWGRFWGWDPKENGALAIVLWKLIVLHALYGGYIREQGLAISSVFCAVVVAASWWGVNLLGVGLHSYGFTSGILLALFGYFAVEALVIVAGVAWGVANQPVDDRPSPAA
ncbi:MAG: cytochrome c biogenesis protein CcsA [Planctomycetia bacterium]|nr:cytochrome c biogenesis protein CcsA [Planctomycetia bacterium]